MSSMPLPPTCDAWCEHWLAIGDDAFADGSRLLDPGFCNHQLARRLLFLSYETASTTVLPGCRAMRRRVVKRAEVSEQCNKGYGRAAASGHLAS